MTTRIGINGFGRIGRSSLRVILDSFEGELEVVKINDLTDNETLAHLLKYDTAYGHLGRTVEHDETSITVGGHHIEVSEEKDPADINWGALDVDIVLECTGKFRTKEDAQAHIDSRREEGHHLRPGQERRRLVRVGCQPRGLHQRPHRHLRGVLHHQLPGPCGEDHQR